MKKLEELGISPAPWSAGINPAMATLLDGYEGKCIYANGDVDNTPYVGFANVVNGDTISAIRNARLMATSPKLYERLMEAVKDKCHFCTATEDERRELCDQCIVADWKDVLAEAAGESEVR